MSISLSMGVHICGVVCSFVIIHKTICVQFSACILHVNKMFTINTVHRSVAREFFQERFIFYFICFGVLPACMYVCVKVRATI